ncbi:O-methyltransferase family 3 protein [Lentinus brumalis]|uniref:O-methyltransferase family 3 protein n=1 Tax=Lentinus brumalis TaxID=2498619 RepID=A0A371DWD3_9APHY|nr:O-methyltransferase family 3 protein [Polyporus brumalis]
MPPEPNPEWIRSDLYHNSFLIARDDALEHARKNSDSQGLPEIAVSAAQGKLLNLNARSIGAKRILEVGTLGGYSTIWLARALPEDGELVTFELSEKHAKVAQENIDYAGLTSKVKIVLGPAAESLKKLSSEPKWDLVFIDADKPSNLTYLLEAERLVRKGGVIIVDNVVRQGRVADPDVNDDNNIIGVRKLLEHLKTDKNVDATTIATVGEKGYDGFLYAVRL